MQYLVGSLVPNGAAGTPGSRTMDHTAETGLFSHPAHSLLHQIKQYRGTRRHFKWRILRFNSLKPKNHLWQSLPCGPQGTQLRNTSRTSSWAASCFPTLMYPSWPHIRPAPNLLFTLPSSHKYSTVNFSYWKENHNFKTGFGPHAQTRRLPKLCGSSL